MHHAKLIAERLKHGQYHGDPFQERLALAAMYIATVNAQVQPTDAHKEDMLRSVHIYIQELRKKKAAHESNQRLQRSRKYKRSAVVFGVALFGWIFACWSLVSWARWRMVSSPSVISSSPSAAAAMLLSTQTCNSSILPDDAFAHLLRYPSAADSPMEHGIRTGTITLVQMLAESSDVRKAAMHTPCQTPTEAFYANMRHHLSGGGGGSGAKARQQPFAHVQTPLNGRADFRDLRYSLQSHVRFESYQFMCAQHVGIPLCYCVIPPSDTPQQQWLDVLGAVNITGFSRDLVLEPNCAKRFFRAVWFRAQTLDGQLHERLVEGTRAVAVQQMYAIHRGLDPCEFDAPNLRQHALGRK